MRRFCAQGSIIGALCSTGFQRRKRLYESKAGGGLSSKKHFRSVVRCTSFSFPHKGFLCAGSRTGLPRESPCDTGIAQSSVLQKNRLLRSRLSNPRESGIVSPGNAGIKSPGKAGISNPREMLGSNPREMLGSNPREMLGSNPREMLGSNPREMLGSNPRPRGRGFDPSISRGFDPQGVWDFKSPGGLG
jgi:hypothetical protein